MATPAKWSKTAQGQWIITGLAQGLKNSAIVNGSAGPGLSVKTPDGQTVWYTGDGIPTVPLTKNANGGLSLPDGREAVPTQDIISGKDRVKEVLAAGGLLAGGALVGSALSGVGAGTAGAGTATAAAPIADNTLKLANAGSTASSVLTNPYVQDLIKGGIGVGSTLLTNNAISDASKTQQQSTTTALANNDAMFKSGQAGLQPFINSGQQANQTLAQIFGLKAPAGNATPPSTSSAAPVTAQPGGGVPNGTFQPSPGANPLPSMTLAAGALTPMRAPTGQIYQVPTNQVAEASANGMVRA